MLERAPPDGSLKESGAGRNGLVRLFDKCDELYWGACQKYRSSLTEKFLGFRCLLSQPVGCRKM